MLVVPFFKDTSNPNWSILHVFLCEGGRSVWSIESDSIMATLQDNGFSVTSLTKEGGIVYASIDSKSLVMKDFYQWSEVDPKTSDYDVWRTLQIPVALWSCPVFREHFWKQAGLPVRLPETLF